MPTCHSSAAEGEREREKKEESKKGEVPSPNIYKMGQSSVALAPSCHRWCSKNTPDHFGGFSSVIFPHVYIYVVYITISGKLNYCWSCVSVLIYDHYLEQSDWVNKQDLKNSSPVWLINPVWSGCTEVSQSFGGDGSSEGKSTLASWTVK